MTISKFIFFQLFLEVLLIDVLWAKEYDFSTVYLELKSITIHPEIIAAVEKQNEQPPKEYANMTNELWKTLAHSNPLVNNLSTNSISKILRSNLKPYITEAFVNSSDGTKVSFLSKPTFWSHRQKDKHEEPMRGKTWQGKMEKDESSGFYQIQISAPILKNAKPIGSIVIGISVAKWESQKK